MGPALISSLARSQRPSRLPVLQAMGFSCVKTQLLFRFVFLGRAAVKAGDCRASVRREKDGLWLCCPQIRNPSLSYSLCPKCCQRCGRVQTPPGPLRADQGSGMLQGPCDPALHQSPFHPLSSTLFTLVATFLPKQQPHHNLKNPVGAK